MTQTDFSDNEGDDEEAPAKVALYSLIIERIFFHHYKKGAVAFEFSRDEIEDAAAHFVKLGKTKKKKVKNVGDVIYTFRHRRSLPAKILETQPQNKGWLILGAGDARYRFRLSKLTHIKPRPGLEVRKLPDATPEIIMKHALNDEQALLAKMRYNRLVDLFLGVTAYSLQNHLRTKIQNYGQIEIDEIYVGVDKSAAQYVIPVQAKGKKDTLGVIQTIQDVTFCQSEAKKSKKLKKDFTRLACRPVSAQSFSVDGKETIAMFELAFDGHEVSIREERHYQLVPADQITDEEQKRYLSTSKANRP